MRFTWWLPASRPKPLVLGLSTWRPLVSRRGLSLAALPREQSDGRAYVRFASLQKWKPEVESWFGTFPLSACVQHGLAGADLQRLVPVRPGALHCCCRQRRKELNLGDKVPGFLWLGPKAPAPGVGI